MKKFTIGFIFACMAGLTNCPFFTGVALSQLSIPAINDTVTVNFTGFTAAGFSPSPTAGQLSSNSWAVQGFSDSALIDFGQTAVSGDFARGISTGVESTGGVYAFITGGGDTLLGVQPTASDFTPGSFTLRIQNNTGLSITDFEIAYSIWCFNDQNRSNSMNFSWSTDNITYSLVPPLDYSTPQPLDSTASWVRTDLATVITGLSIANGAFFYLSWTGNDAGGSGSRDELGLDEIKIIARAPLVSADFNATSVCKGSSTFFTDLSNTVNDSIVSWTWSFGDGDSSVLQNPSHLYAASGTFTVTLLVKDNLDSAASVSKIITVNPVPVANFAVGMGCQSSPVQFTDLSSITSGSISFWSWNFGDGNTDSLSNPSHIYSDTGTVTVTLIAISDSGCTGTVSYSIFIYPAPVINTSGMTITNTGCGDSTGSIIGITASGSGTISYEWTNDSGTVAGTSADLSAVLAGSYTLIATMAQCYDATGPITVADTAAPPAPDAGLDGTVCGLSSVLQGFSGGGTIIWSQISGSGTTVITTPSSDSTNVTASQYGSYTYRLTETIAGCSGFDEVLILFGQQPVAGFTFTTNGAVATFTNTSSGGTSPVVYTWNFGDGTGTSNLASPSYTYSVTDSYNVCLTLNDSTGCTDLFCDSVNVIITAIKENAAPGGERVYVENSKLIIVSNPSNPVEGLTIFNLVGEKLFECEKKNGMTNSIELPHAGIFLVWIRSKNGSGYYKVVR